MNKTTFLFFFISISSLLLCACPPGANKRIVSPPGPTSLAYSCDLSLVGGAPEGLSSNQTIYFTWLEVSSPNAPGKILISDDKFDQQTAAVMFVVDNEKHIVDQIRDRFGKPISFDLNSKYLSSDDATSQSYMRVGNLILDSSARALSSAPKNADSVSFQFEQKIFDFSVSESIPTVENYSLLPRTISSGSNPVCSFIGFNKKSPSSGGGN